MVDHDQQEERDKGNDHQKEVKIEVDNHPQHIAPGTYVISVFKTLVKVAAEKELDQVVNGQLTALDDSASVAIKGGEVFFSHTRRGGSS